MKYYIITLHSFYGSSLEGMYARNQFGPFPYVNDKEAHDKTEALNKRLSNIDDEMLAQYIIFDIDKSVIIPDDNEDLKEILEIDNDYDD